MRNILTAYVSLVFAILFFQSCGSNQVENAQKLLDLKSYDQAIELLEKEIQEEPDNFEAHFTLANAFASKAFQNVEKPSYELINKSISSYKSAAILKPNDFSVSYNLGVVLYLSGNNNESIENLPYVKYNVALEIKDTKNLSNNILKVYNTDISNEKMKIFIEKYLYKFDGKASSRSAKAILEMLSVTNKWKMVRYYLCKILNKAPFAISGSLIPSLK